MVTATRGWTGPRKNDFADAGAGMQIHLKTLATALTGASTALHRYATVLRTAQQDIARYASAAQHAADVADQATDHGKPDVAADTRASQAATHNRNMANGARNDVHTAKTALLGKLHDISTVLVPGTETLTDAQVAQKVLAAFHQTGLPATGATKDQAWGALAKARTDSPDDVVRTDGAVNWPAWVGQQTNAEHASAKTPTLWDCLQDWEITPQDHDNPAMFYLEKLGFLPEAPDPLNASNWSVGLIGMSNQLTRETLSRYIITEFRYRDPVTGKYAKPSEDFNKGSVYKNPNDTFKEEPSRGLQAKPGWKAFRKGMFKWTGRIARVAGPAGMVTMAVVDGVDTWKEDSHDPKMGLWERIGRTAGSGLGSGVGGGVGGSLGAAGGAALGIESGPGSIVTSFAGGVTGAWMGSTIGEATLKRLGGETGKLGGGLWKKMTFDERK
ncbi:hypothetical protein [Luteipulveratus mongoliensis]|nr:hypothetical protein [Luteipulveratus mongoliensis]